MTPPKAPTQHGYVEVARRLQLSAGTEEAESEARGKFRRFTRFHCVAHLRTCWGGSTGLAWR